MRHKYIIGIDEVGRGPLAGPVAVGAVCIYAEYHKRVTKLFPVVKDSKKLTPKSRAEWHERIREAEKLGYLSCSVSFVTPSVIDKKGLSYAIRTAIEKSLSAIEHDAEETRVLLDGALRAPSHYQNQETIIKGDEKELVIALASIVAKTARDARMVLLAKKFPAYGFEKHKGYGTRAHYEAIKKNGIIPHHRKSFLRGLV
ncbi:MAG: ribonuclease HII [Minisyncoccia bacterium]